MHGMESTVGVSLDLMIMHGKAVVRGTQRALVVVDMPFGTYEESPSVAFRNAARVMKETQCGAVKLEGMVEPLAARITRQISIPTIGIGASKECDGQILVLEDMLGLNPTPPKFVKVYGNLGGQIEAAVKAYSDEVKDRSFSGKAQVYR